MSDVIRSFLVSYGFDVDTAGMSKAESATRAAEDRITAANAAALNKRIAQEKKAQADRIARALKAGEQLTADDRRFVLEQEKNRNAAADAEKKREADAAARRQAAREETFKKTEAQALKLTSLAIKTVAAFDIAKIVDSFTFGAFSRLNAAAGGFERLKYSAESAGTSVKGIQAFSFAIEQLGGSADGAESELKRFGDNLKTFPQYEKSLQSMGIATRDAAGNMKDAADIAEDFMDHLSKIPPAQRAVREAQAEMFGFSPDTVQAGIRPGHRGFYNEERARQAALGANADAAGEAGAAFSRSMRALQDAIQGVRTKIETALFGLFKPMLDRIAGWIEDHGKAISTAVIAVAKGIGDVVSAFVDSGAIKTAVDAISDGLETFAKYIGSGEFKRDIKSFAADVIALAKALRRGLELLGILPSSTGTSAIPGSADFDGVTESSGGVGGSGRHVGGGASPGASLGDHGRGGHGFGGGPGPIDANLPTGNVPGASGYGLINAYWKGALDKPGEGGFTGPKELFDYLKSQGATDNEALMLTGAAASESSFNPHAVHDHGTGYGLFGHKIARLDMRGKDWRQQSMAALAEARRMLGDRINAARTPEELADLEMHYEGPRGYHRATPRSGDNYMGRLNSIRRFSALTQHPATFGPSAVAPVPAGTSAAAIGDAAAFAAEQRLRAGGSDPKDRALVERYRQQQNAPNGPIAAPAAAPASPPAPATAAPAAAPAASTALKSPPHPRQGTTYPGWRTRGADGEVYSTSDMRDPRYAPHPDTHTAIPGSAGMLEQGFSPGAPVKVDVVKATPLSEASKEVAQHLRNLGIVSAASHGMLHPFLHGPLISPTEAMRRHVHNSIRHATASVTHNPTYNVHGTTVEAGLAAAKAQGERGTADLVRNIGPLFA